MTPGKDCKNTCVSHTSSELAALSAVVAVSAAVLVFVGRRRRAGRSDEEIHQAIDCGQFHAAVGTWNYSVQPNVDTWYCSRCCERRLYE